MDIERIRAAQAGLVFALVEADPEADDGTLNVADVENAGSNEIILKGTFNTHTPAVIALHYADRADEERGIKRGTFGQEDLEGAARAIYEEDESEMPWEEVKESEKFRYRIYALAASRHFGNKP